MMMMMMTTEAGEIFQSYAACNRFKIRTAKSARQSVSTEVDTCHTHYHYHLIITKIMFAHQRPCVWHGY